MRKSVSLCLGLVLATALTACGTGPGGAPTVAPSFPALNATDFASGQAFSVLPPGDMLATVDVGTLLNQTIPAALANSPEQKAKFDAELKDWQAKYGVDPNQIKLMAVSVSGLSGNQSEAAAVVTGAFDVEKLKAALAKDPETGAASRTETYADQTIYVRTATANGKSEEVAAAVLNPTTLVMGTPAAVRKAIDAAADKGADATSNTELFNLFKETKETGIVRFAMATPPEDPAQAQGNPMTQAFAAARFVFGSLDATSGLGFDVTMRTATAQEAQPLYTQLSQGVEAGKQMVGQNPEMQGFKTLLDSMSVTQNERDVKVALNLSPIQLLLIYDQFQKMAGGMTAPGGAPAGGMPGEMPGEMPDSNANTNETEP